MKPCATCGKQCRRAQMVRRNGCYKCLDCVCSSGLDVGGASRPRRDEEIEDAHVPRAGFSGRDIRIGKRDMRELRSILENAPLSEYRKLTERFLRRKIADDTGEEMSTGSKVKRKEKKKKKSKKKSKKKATKPQMSATVMGQCCHCRRPDTLLHTTHSWEPACVGCHIIKIAQSSSRG